MVYHGPKAMEELVRYDPHLVVGILGGSAGTTRDAFQLLHDAQKYGAKVALFGRKINNAENQLAFVHFLRLIVEGQIGPVEAVKAYHAVLGQAGTSPASPPGRRPEVDRPVDELFGNQELPAVVPRRRAGGCPSLASAKRPFSACHCVTLPRNYRSKAEQNGRGRGHAVVTSALVTESSSSVSRYNHSRVSTNGQTFIIQRPTRLHPDEPGRALGLSSRATWAGALIRKRPLDYPISRSVERIASMQVYALCTFA